MLRSSPSTDPGDAADDAERGSAALEFILVGLVLLVPLVYLVVALGLIQEQSLGAEAGARHIARAIATAGDAEDAEERADLVLESIVQEYGLDADGVALSLSCRPAGAECPRAGATLVVTLRAAVALPLVPSVLGLDRLASVPIEAFAAHKVSRFWGSE
ncbi:TadE family protein [Microbacterium sulfonylureivorans]|uniref:TadE family protein n=1 Tax=Microbacterium sulfonylureivorans TaxID=2486854 RepID=UPI000FD932F6|nr:TadE family protein [Microbacterium sulfonylureivorans]